MANEEPDPPTLRKAWEHVPQPRKPSNCGPQSEEAEEDKSALVRQLETHGHHHYWCTFHKRRPIAPAREMLAQPNLPSASDYANRPFEVSRRRHSDPGTGPKGAKHSD